MRILLVLGMSAGGVGTHVRGLAAGLAADGHDVVVAGPAQALATFDLAGTGAQRRDVPIAERPDPRRDTAAVATLRRLARDAEVVHAHGLRAGALSVLAATRSPVPVVVTLHNAAPTGRATRLVYAGLERVVARRATVVLGVSRDLVGRMTTLG
ncbi:MAG: glycosyltransferase, partial [Nostocoides sp.]